MNETIDVLMSHMSIRKFTEQQIEGDKLHQVIKAAQWTPTSSHFQAFTIIHIKDAQKREAMAEIAGGQKWVKDSPVFLVFCADLYRAEKYWKDADKRIFSNQEMFIVATVDAALAAQKAYIAAESLGLGGVFVGGIRNNLGAVSELLKLPQLVYPIFGMCLGYPAENPGQKPRLPIDVIYKIDQYDDQQDNALVALYDREVKEYYLNRTNGKIQDTWSERCGGFMMEKTRADVSGFIKEKGLNLI
ncbi:MAG: hypothetical protein H6Q72_3112 [Firmicutes bacterium]|nr:hypothetical protein [Bacillota bacterium]